MLVLSVLTGLAVILAFVGLISVALRRRRRANARPAAIARRRPLPVQLLSERRPIIVRPAETSVAAPVASIVPETRLSHPTAGNRTGASVDLPACLPDSFEEREALVRRMVAAAPDRANPFRSPGARRRRARLILQSLGRTFDHADPWIDLSQYPDIWPEVARRRLQQAA